MAKNKGKKGKVERSLYNFNNSINAIFEKTKPLTNKEKKELLKQTEKDIKKSLKKYNKSQKFEDYMQFSILKTKERKLSKDDRLPIEYGNFEFNVKSDYFLKLKDKEKYMDGLYNRKMKSILSKLETPKTESEANEMESLMVLYAKKLQDREFYDKGLVQNVLNKLENFQSGLNLWKMNDTSKIIVETGEVPESEIYDLIESPVVLDGKLLSLKFIFF